MDLSTTATFSSPQGLAVRDEMLYVADTENHMLRQIDLQQKTVTTLAGTGEQAEEIVFRSSRQPTRMRLASPWDLWLHEDDLYIAMAGSHQLWRYLALVARVFTLSPATVWKTSSMDRRWHGRPTNRVWRRLPNPAGSRPTGGSYTLPTAKAARFAR